MRRYAVNSISLKVRSPILLTILTVAFTRPLLRVMQTPENIFNYAYDYIIILLREYQLQYYIIYLLVF